MRIILIKPTNKGRPTLKRMAIFPELRNWTAHEGERELSPGFCHSASWMQIQRDPPSPASSAVTSCLGEGSPSTVSLPSSSGWFCWAKGENKNYNIRKIQSKYFFKKKFTRSFHRFIHYRFALLVVESISFVTSSKLLMIINRLGGWEISLSTAGSSACSWEPLPSLGVFQSCHL